MRNETFMIEAPIPAGVTARIPDCYGLVVETRSTTCQSALQLTAMRDSSSLQAVLVASTDDNDARVEQS
jgi:hypothetical protein